MLVRRVTDAAGEREAGNRDEFSACLSDKKLKCDMIRNRTNVGKTQPSQLLTGQSQFCTKYAIFLFQKLSFQFMLLYRMYFPLFVEYNSHNIFLSFDGLKSLSRKWYFYDDLPHIKFANPPRFESSRKFYSYII